VLKTLGQKMRSLNDIEEVDDTELSKVKPVNEENNK
jgi:hypothetical protein